MKKIIIVVFCLLMLVSCSSKKTIKIDSSINRKLQDLVFTVDNQEIKPFTEQTVISSKDYIQYGINQANYQELYFSLSLDNLVPLLYFIALPNEGAENKVKGEIQALLDQQKGVYGDYSPKAVQLIDDALKTNLGDYLIYVVSYDNDLVYQTIEENVTE